MVARRPSAQTRGRVIRFFPGEGLGFLETVDGREVYFNRTSQLEPGFHNLTLGCEVTVPEEHCRTHTVRIADKPQPVEIREIAVCLDGSAYAEGVLPYAQSMARSLDARLTLISVLEHESESDLAGYLRAVSRRLGIQAKLRRVSGAVVDALLEELRSPGILPVLSTQGRGAVSEVLFGSVASEILRRIGRPVLIDRPRSSGDALSVNGLVFPIRNIAVALDGSDFAEKMLPFAAMMAKQLGARLNLLQAAGGVSSTRKTLCAIPAPILTLRCKRGSASPTEYRTV